MLLHTINDLLCSYFGILFVLFFSGNFLHNCCRKYCLSFQLLSFSENISCIIVSGGHDRPIGHLGQASETVEVLIEDLGTKQITNLPREVGSQSMVHHDGAILLCGGISNLQICLKLDHGTWKRHSTLNQERVDHSAVTTQTATFLFGGSNSRHTYEYLPKGSSTWLMGKIDIPSGFGCGCAIAVKSDQEIWLIGGYGTEKRILSFSVSDHTFKELPYQLNVGRFYHSCAFIPNTRKVMIAGGFGDDEDFLNTTEILDTVNGTITMATPMNSKRYTHGMGVLTIKGEDRLAVFGGFDGNTWLDTVELYNAKTEKWHTSDIKLNAGKSDFGFLTVKLSDVFSELQCNNN